jgi:cleavage and polyadenylation specificity factor subunit 4
MLPELNVPTRLSKDYIKKYRAAPARRKEEPSTRESERLPANYRTALCKFFLVNSCKKGESCAYSHDTSQFPCRAFHIKKNCTKKNCGFSHEKASEEALQELEGPKTEELQFISTLL